MTTFEARDQNFEARVQASFDRQKAMQTIGASLTRVTPGEVEIQLPFRDDLTQQHGFIQGGIVTAIVDNACGYASLSLMPVDAAVLTVEYKVNFVSPAVGERIIARGRVIRPGSMVMVCAGDVFACTNGNGKLVATMLATFMTLRDRPDLID